MNLLSRRLMTVLLGLLVIGFIVPAAEAQAIQGPKSGSKTPQTGLQPELGSFKMELLFDYVFDTGEQLSGLSKTTAQANFNFNCGADNSNILISGARSINFVIDPSGSTGSTSAPFSGTFDIAVTRQLVGLKNIPCTYTVTVPPPDPSGGSVATLEEATFSGSFNVKANYYGLVQAKVERQIQKAGPQKEIPFQIQLDNFGNAKTTVQFSLDQQPKGSKWLAGIPDDVILDSRNDGGPKPTDTATFLVTTTYKNGWNNEAGTYRMKMKVFASDDPAQTAPDLYTNMLVRVRGVYVPSLEPFVMVGALLGTALVIRMQRQE
jgi:hypothetical protein